MNKKAISILLTAAMGVSVLAAGTVTVSAAEKKDKYVIGMSQCNLGEPWRVAMNDQFVRSKVLKELLVESTEIMVSAKVSRKMTRLKS